MSMTHVENYGVSTPSWAEPYNSGPIHVSEAGINVVDAAQLARLHAEFRPIHTNRINVDQAIKRIIVEAYDNMNTSQLALCTLLRLSKS
jgi:hypothetical protein